MAVQADEEIFEMLHVLRDLAVEDRKDLHEHEEDAGDHGIGDDLGQRLDGLFSGVEAGESAQDEAEKDQEGRAGSKGRSQKTRRHDGREPEAPAREDRRK